MRPAGRNVALEAILLCLTLALTLWGEAACAAEVLRIGGTGASLATFRQLAVEFAKTRPGLRVEISPSLGSGGGIRALADGALDVALSARPLKEDEKTGGLVLTEYGSTPLAFVVGPDNACTGVTLAEVTEIYAGSRRTWPDGTPIRLVLRPAADTDTPILRAMSPQMGKAVDEASRREDQGIGIAPGDIAHIFDPYFTTKPGGSGLGLAVVYSIVQRHGGSLAVDSTPGRGSRFEVCLPASDHAAEDPPQASPEPRAAVGRLLLMDDDDLVREAAREVFSHLGYDVTTVRDGGEALDRYEEAARAGCPFDFVVLDLTVPGGMGGEETVRRLRERHGAAIVVASSGYCGGGALADYQARGFDQILSKPYRLADVTEAFASLEALRAARGSSHPGPTPTAPP